MIDKIQFLIKVSIYLINFIVGVLYVLVYKIQLIESTCTKEFLDEIHIINNFDLLFNTFLLIYYLFVIIYEEIVDFNIIIDISLTLFYFIFIISMVYNNTQVYIKINDEENNFNLAKYGIPNIGLDQMKYLYSFVQGFFVLILVLLIIKTILSIYRVIEEDLIRHFQNGGTLFFFEINSAIV